MKYNSFRRQPSEEEVVEEDLPTLESVEDVDIERVFIAFVRRAAATDAGSRRSSGNGAEAAGNAAATAAASDSTELTLNVMQFSSIWRLLTGNKGNLFQEMQIFHKYVQSQLIILLVEFHYSTFRFDSNNNGCLSVDEFVAGWRQMASQPGGERLVRKIKTLSNTDNVIL